MDQHFDEHGLMLGLDKVKLDGLKPRRLAFPEKTGSRGPPMEVRDLPMMPSGASLSSKKSLCRLEMKKVPCEGCGFKMNEKSKLDFQRIREMHEQNIDPIQIIDVPPGIRGASALIGSEIGTPSHEKDGVG